MEENVFSDLEVYLIHWYPRYASSLPLSYSREVLMLNMNEMR